MVDLTDPDSIEGQMAADIDFLLEVCIGAIDGNEADPDAFLAWARGAIPELVPAFAEPDVEQTDVWALWLARAIWDATPLESNGYRPRPLHPPERNQPCPCGSAKKYKHCCRELPPIPEFPEEAMWGALVRSRFDAHWIAAARSGRLPTTGLLTAAEQFAREERWRSLKDLVEAVFAEGASLKDPNLCLLVYPLCDAYDALYRTDRNKVAFLERIRNHPMDAIRNEANQRLASVLHDKGELTAAWEAVERARQAAPDDPANAALEISLLVAESRYDRARERAGFWLRRLRKQQDVPERVVSLLENVRADPGRALAEVGRDAAPAPVSQLLDWIDRHAERPLPELISEPLDSSPSEDDGPLFDAWEIVPGNVEVALIEQWQDLSNIGKPFSVHWLAGDETDAWSTCDEWLPWLEAHPEAMDSVDILDDLVSLLLASQDVIGTIDNPWVDVLLGRGVDMLNMHWPSARTGRLPWLVTENRPALRMLSRAIAMADERNDPSSLGLQHFYLRLNPEDSHGFRSLLINALLRAGENERALDLADQYDDDMMAETTYGRVLALYRLGRRGEALGALTSAAQRLPVVLDFLVRERVAKPPADPYGVTIGGKDQAWQYREEMRGEWLRTEDAIAWLKPVAKKHNVRARSRNAP